LHTHTATHYGCICALIDGCERPWLHRDGGGRGLVAVLAAHESPRFLRDIVRLLKARAVPAGFGLLGSSSSGGSGGGFSGLGGQDTGFGLGGGASHDSVEPHCESKAPLVLSHCLARAIRHGA
jgi:hypothetical protein